MDHSHHHQHHTTPLPTSGGNGGEGHGGGHEGHMGMVSITEMKGFYVEVDRAQRSEVSAGSLTAIHL